ncbi:hypothetical protein AX14_002198, partial [Amanita brunnescens Koide BX004]
VLDSDDHATLVKKLKKVYSVDVQVLNRGTTPLLKFPIMLTRHPDGSAVTSEWLHKTITGHPKWHSVEFVQKPHFIIPTALQALVSISVSQAVWHMSPVGSLNPPLLIKVHLVQYLHQESQIKHPQGHCQC